MTLIGDDLTIDYFPKIYVEEQYMVKSFDSTIGAYIDVAHTRKASQAIYDDYVKRAVKGIKQWAKNNIMIQGAKLNVAVNVTPTQVNKKSDADIVITAFDTVSGSMVPETIIPGWSTSVKTHIYLDDIISDSTGNPYYVSAKNQGDKFANSVSHEFGHVLGLFDAYGYAQHIGIFGFIFPEAPFSVADEYSVMRSELWHDMTYNSIEYEMLLYAWSRSELQLYVDSILGSPSQAFYH
jgi:hypothetical protein